MSSTWTVVAAALAALLGAVSVKFWSSIRLMRRYRIEDSLAIAEARRRYWAGKMAPLVARRGHRTKKSIKLLSNFNCIHYAVPY